MITIRPATPEDLDVLSEMGEHFFGYSAFSKFAPFDRTAARAAIARLASSDLRALGLRSLRKLLAL